MTQLPVAVVFSGATGHDTRLPDRSPPSPPLSPIQSEVCAKETVKTVYIYFECYAFSIRGTFT